MFESNLQNLTEGGPESLRALIQAIVPEAAVGPDGKFSGDTVAHLTKKLSQIVDPEGVENFEQKRNTKGELVNEEGLPIIDISEPFEDNSSRSIPPPITVEPLLPLADLPLSSREILRARRNRILDLLEAEEQQSKPVETRLNKEERDELLRKRKEDAATVRDKAKMKELQKKMGRALLQNIGKARDKEFQEREAQRIRDEEADKRRSPSAKKKTVSFLEGSELVDDISNNWGDLTPARLRSTKKQTLISKTQFDRHPMKMSVVERVPSGQSRVKKLNKIPDSDDESDGEDASDFTENHEDGTHDDEEFDLDFAKHQREIALDYHRKRNTCVEAAALTMEVDTHHLDDLTEASFNLSPKPAISQFKASQLTSAYSASHPSSGSSTSLHASVLPASSARTIQRAVRNGTLDPSGKLIGRENESASEDENENIQDVLALLRKGEVYNVGPQTKLVSNGVAARIPQQSQKLPRSTTSKFKATRAPLDRFHMAHDSFSPSVMSNNIVPTLVSPLVPLINERSDSPSMGPSQIPSPSLMIVESPSFPKPQTEITPVPKAISPVVPSPSFPPRVGNRTRRPEHPPFVLSASVRESTPPVLGDQFDGSTRDIQPEKKISRFKAERM